MITSLEIQNFRCFKRLSLDSLKRVNLIVGANNSGKTSLLEALFFLKGSHNPEISLRLNHWRGIQQFASTWEETWGWLFYRKEPATGLTVVAKDGSTFEQSVIARLAPPREFVVTLSGQNELPLSSGKVAVASDNKDGTKRIAYGGELSELVLDYQDSGGHKFTTRAMLTPDGTVRVEQARVSGAKRAVFLHIHSRNFKEQAEQFSRLKSSGGHEEVLKALQSIEPRLKGLDILVIGGEPVMHGDIGIGRPVPLPMMGEGFNRILAIVLAIADCPGGIVLVDEIENGLHYLALEKLWIAVREAAEKSDVQVFATTHSRECVLAAHSAFKQDSAEGISVTRLQYVNGQLEAAHFEAEHLELAADMGLEVRA